MNATDESTPRPWVINRDTDKELDKNIWISSEYFPNICATDSDDMPEGAGMANATLIVKAVNEHDALIAVAEAAERFRKYYFDDLAKSNPGFLSKLVLQDYQEMMAIGIALPRALSNLAALRAKEVA